MGASEKHAATFHPGDGPTPLTAADVLREHYGSMWCPACGVGSAKGEHGAWRWDVVQHQAAMLAAAGLLATAERDAELIRIGGDAARMGYAARAAREAEHDREVAARALRDAADQFACDNDSLTFRQRVIVETNARYELRARADRIAAGDGTGV